MITFLVSIVLLIVAYFTYGKYVEKVFGVKEQRKTPAYTLADGVDYVPMSKNKNSLIQLLNIAGVGPIFGPIMGALYGPIAFLWIVLGAIFAGAVHDYLTGMISLRNKGAHLPDLAGKFLGKAFKHVVNVFALLLLVLVGTVFVSSPAALLGDLTKGWMSVGIWIIIIFAYYILATILPVDKIIGRFYPIFGALLLISAVGIGAALLIQGYTIPELSFQNMHPDNLPIFPLLFLTISCGALSGFHATQSPIISRTTQGECQGRYIFYGMMIAEAIIAMIWAAAAMSIFNGQDLNTLLNTVGTAGIVKEVSVTTLGAVVGTIAVLGVVVLPITSGDTAFRSARMIIADYIGMAQKKASKRFVIAIPMFVISIALTQVDFTILWRYFSWANQSTAAIALWVGAMYLALQKKNFWIAAIPATFITMATFTYIFNAKIGFNLSMQTSYIAAIVVTVIIIIGFFWGLKRKLEAAESGFKPIVLDDGLGTQPAK
ncbi:carbon starvation protein A [Psychrobacillus psychrodurans]|uniref:carbon starvation CstA family protein n=1 Tax=Psychrobacillus psychrodurans TaxID=126157 RepID=UPI001F4E2AE0|nr:carbon starvation CstA family protein [Psychrobacillus psychrodurans]MCK1997690.1 carbon starvation protein A [Psychrobacillus psychrodurans]